MKQGIQNKECESAIRGRVNIYRTGGEQEAPLPRRAQRICRAYL